MLKEKILNREPGILTYGLTPPKLGHPPEKIKEISQKHIERIRTLELDGLILYDIQEENSRVEEERPFPYLETIDPAEYSERYFGELSVPKIIYRCVGKYTGKELTEWIKKGNTDELYSVFVGAASRSQEVRLSLSEAYKRVSGLDSSLILGGVTIPERHLKQRNEHLKVIGKMASGCRFFVSQCVYNVEAAKNFLSDYYYYCRENRIDMVPVLFTMTPCGSLKTLDFMKWLGVSIPGWLENELIHSEDILDQSVELCRRIFKELFSFGCSRGIPVGCNVESVSVRKVEIDASVALVRDIKTFMDKEMKRT